MPAQILDGKEVSTAVKERVRGEAEAFAKEHGRAPSLTVILVGDDPASAVYVRNKHKACRACGITSEEIKLPADTKEELLLSEIARLNADENVDGILVQLPLPKQISEEAVIRAIAPDKDVDAFHPENVGKIMTGGATFLPCTPAGVMELLHYYKIEISGKRCAVIGRSNIVGKPMFHLLMAENGTVTVCHSKTPNVAEITKECDIVVAAVGRAAYLTPDMVKPGAVLVDVGINRTQDGKLVGDIDPACAEVASYLSPVPGGVGPMTIAMLMQNTLRAAKLHF